MIPTGIANSSPLISLARIMRLDILRNSFGAVLIPPSVASEIGDVPSWVQVTALRAMDVRETFPSQIHSGEAEVIRLGMEQPEGVLVLDDWYAREFALRRSMKVMGTMGLLLRAKREGRLDFVLPIVDELVSAGFRLSKNLREDVRRLAAE